MTIQEVLAEIGADLGQRGRTRCPLHDGGNPTSFKYNEEWWNCFACGEHGGVRRLRKLLGLPQPKEELQRVDISGVVAFGDMLLVRSRAKALERETLARRPSRILKAALAAHYAAHAEQATELHLWALDKIDVAQVVLHRAGPVAFETWAKWMREAYDALDYAHRVLGTCFEGCGREGGGGPADPSPPRVTRWTMGKSTTMTGLVSR